MGKQMSDQQNPTDEGGTSDRDSRGGVMAWPTAQATDMRRFKIAVLAATLASFGLIGPAASPSSAAMCGDDGSPTQEACDRVNSVCQKLGGSDCIR
jgi:hypothetical protein